MEKFLRWDFFLLLILSLLLLITHELGHYIAFQLLGYRAALRKSIVAPGIDPVETINIPRWQGVFIAMNGFLFSSIVVLLPCALLQYRLWIALLIGGAAGSLADILWAAGMLFQKRVTICSARERKS